MIGKSHALIEIQLLLEEVSHRHGNASKMSESFKENCGERERIKVEEKQQ
jgi:hypothetical protein